MNPQSRVQDFLIPHSSLWNRALIEKTFDHTSASQILQLCLPVSPEDFVIWAPELLGGFSVKSAYQLLLQDGDHSMAPSPPIDWKCLWKLDMHARLNFFLWKIAWDALPTRINLADTLQDNFQGLLMPIGIGSIFVYHIQ